MGNKASKAASSATKTATTIPPVKESPSSSSSAVRNINRNIDGNAVTAASESKDSAILNDARDPSTPGKGLLSQNLASLGQASVRSAQSHNPARFTVNQQAAGVLQRRAELEESESTSSSFSPRTRNRLSAANLTTLLDARKEITTPAEFKKLCEDFNCDPVAIQQLGKYITSPSLTLQRTKEQEKDDIYIARWVDPKNLQERIGS